MTTTATETRNVVDEETAQHNRTSPHRDGYTFNAFPPVDYEGTAFTFAVLRIGDHAHIKVGSGRHVPPHPGQGRNWGQVHDGHAGRMILRWNEWLVMRETLDADPRYRIAEVENPSDGQIKFHLQTDAGGNDNE